MLALRSTSVFLTFTVLLLTASPPAASESKSQSCSKNADCAGSIFRGSLIEAYLRCGGFGDALDSPWNDRGCSDGHCYCGSSRCDFRRYRIAPVRRLAELPAPTARLSVDIRGSGPWEVRYNAGGSEPYQAIAEYAWDLDGDGGFASGGRRPVQQRTCTKPGLYRAGVRVRDMGGRVSEAIVEFTLPRER